jgi:hypothetical protein
MFERMRQALSHMTEPDRALLLELARIVVKKKSIEEILGSTIRPDFLGSASRWHPQREN